LLQQQYILEKQQLLVKQQQQQQQTEQLQLHTKISETIRKRQYRIGLNLFNKKPEKGVTYLIHKGFLENSPHAVAKFLISRKGLSRQMIGEYLGNLQQPFNMAVLAYFADEMDFSKMAVDVALRKFQGYFRMPGEAQKIERLMEIFSQRYCDCNPDVVSKLRSSDTIFVLAFAIIMLNTDLHTPNIKADRRMKCEDFIKNLRGIDDCMDIDRNMLEGIYNRVKESEFKTASDHVTQVMKVQKTIVGKKLNLALPHRRLVCYCRLYEIPDINKKERSGLHQREVFLFNDLLVVTKIFTKKKTSVTYTFRNSYSLCGLVVTLLDVPNYPYCIRLSQKVDGKVLATFNARNEHDRCKFADDLRESITEMDEMESLRIEMELERQLKATRCVGNVINNNMDNRDSGVGDMEIQFSTSKSYETKSSSSNDLQSGQLKRGGALSNSLLDIHEQFGNEVRRERRGSVGSLDSGMSISFQSTSTNTTGSSVTNGKVEPTNGVFVNSVVAMAVAAGKSTVVTSRAQHQMQQQITSGQHLLQNAAGQIIMQAVPPLLPNSALYQYNTEQNMLHLQDIYEDHHVSSSGSSSSITKTAAGPRSTDV
jgi:IQ motif/SEC7 domain-containing protein